MLSYTCLRTAAVFGFLAVALGAFGAHGLKPRLVANDTLEIWKTAVDYHFYHALVLLFLSLCPGVPRGMTWSFASGIVVFSGSLYLLALTNVRWLGAVTPVGGVAFLVGWAWLFVFSFARVGASGQS